MAGFAYVFLDIVAHNYTQYILKAIGSEIHVAKLLPAIKWAWALALLGAAYHEFVRYRERKQEVYFADSVDLLLYTLDRLVSDPAISVQQKLETFITRTVQVARSSFKQKRTVRATFSRSEGEYLVVACVDPPEPNTVHHILALGQGGSGYAAQKRAIVYFPSIWNRHGIEIEFDRSPLPTKPAVPRIKAIRLSLFVPKIQERMSLLATILRRRERSSKFKTLLTVPVASENTAPDGVLNFDSVKRDAFSEVDFKTASVFGQILGLAFKRLRS